MTIAFVMGANAPFMHRLYEAYARQHCANLHVFECSPREPSRRWARPQSESYQVATLPGFRYHKSDISHVYVNPTIISKLARLKPNVIVICSFGPTMIMAGLYAIAAGCALGLFVDGSRELDPGEHSWPHATARRFFGRRADFGLCSSRGSIEMMEHWGLQKGTGVLMPYFGNWNAPTENPPFDSRPFDLLFCGTLNERKNPLFFADVVERMVAKGMSPRVRVVGDGALREPLAARLAACKVAVRMDGHLQHPQIIDAFRSSKILLFPTRADTWGLVANEALMCETAVLASPHAESSKDLVQRFATGLVRELDAEVWADTAIGMLTSNDSTQSFFARRHEAMALYSIESAVAGLAHAIEIGRTSPRNPRRRRISREHSALPARATRDR